MLDVETEIARPINGCVTTKIYCRPNCPPSRRTKPENRVHFSSSSEARSAGFRSCLVCTPDAPADGLAWISKSLRKHGCFVFEPFVEPVVCGVAYCLLLMVTRKKGLGPVIWAHGITNALLWVYTIQTDVWRFL